MSWEDDGWDNKEPECPYWGDGEHHWQTDQTHDHRYGRVSEIELYCKCGATKSDISFD